MNIEDFLDADLVFADVKASSKKQILQQLARAWATHYGYEDRVVFEKLLEREKLGTTGVGKGVAIPHARLPSVNRITGLFARLSTPVDFDSVDDVPVDLIFMLVAPEDAGADHLKTLAWVSRLLRSQAMCDKFRNTPESAALYALLTHPVSNAA